MSVTWLPSKPDPVEQSKVLTRLTKAGQDWHHVSKHAGLYGACPEKTCYHTHRAVAR